MPVLLRFVALPINEKIGTYPSHSAQEKPFALAPNLTLEDKICKTTLRERANVPEPGRPADNPPHS